MKLKATFRLMPQQEHLFLDYFDDWMFSQCQRMRMSLASEESSGKQENILLFSHQKQDAVWLLPVERLAAVERAEIAGGLWGSFSRRI